MLLISGKRMAGGVEKALGDVTVSFGLQQAAQMTLSITDLTGVMTRSELASTGTIISADNGRWQVGGMQVTNLGASTTSWTVRARSALARRLRKQQAKELTRVRAVDWIERTVKAAGGGAICQPSQRRTSLDPADDETVMDVIDALAQDLGWSWAEYGGRIVFMDPHWVWSEQPKSIPMWAVTWGSSPATDALSLDTDLDDDDSAALGTGNLTLPHGYGRRLRPLHIVDLGKGLAGKRAGAWCVTNVDFVLNRPESPVSVQIARPRKGIPQARTGGGDSVGRGRGLLLRRDRTGCRSGRTGGRVARRWCGHSLRFSRARSARLTARISNFTGRG